MIAPFAIAAPGRILFGRGESAKAPGLLRGFGSRGVLIHGASAARAAWLADGLLEAGCSLITLSCPKEPDLPMLMAAIARARDHAPDWVVALGGGAVVDLGKAVAALVPGTGDPLKHLEVVGQGLPLDASPLPFIAIPTTSGTGAEATKNAVIGLPEHGRKVSLRDDRMLPRIAIVDPALTDNAPWGLTLASGLDAVTQVIEPYVSCKATPFTDAITRAAIPAGLKALTSLRHQEVPEARDAMAWVSLSGGLALANAGLGAVHGLAGVIGGVSPAPHGAVCGALLGPVLRANLRAVPHDGQYGERLREVCGWIAAAMGGGAFDAPEVLAHWAKEAGLPGLEAQGLDPALLGEVVKASLSSSSMKGNPVPLPVEALAEVMRQAL